jgi:hypothetical protein
MADDVQPDEGQGAAPYAAYLERFPEDQREIAEAAFKEWDGQTTKKFMEAADYRKQMEPYAPVIEGLDPDAVRWGTDFYRAVTSEDPDTRAAVKAWVKENGFVDEAGIPEVDLTDPDLVAALDARLGPITQTLEQLSGRFQQQEQQAQMEAASQTIETQLAQSEEKLGALYDREIIIGLAANYKDGNPEDAISRATTDWEKRANGLKVAAMQGKLDTTAPAAETGGTADGSVPKISTFEQATEAVKARLAQQ